jgi:aminopeptidase N
VTKLSSVHSWQYASDERFRYKYATTEDFREVCEAVSGTDLQYFFDQWIYDQYYPEYEYSFEQDQQNMLSINLNQVQSSYGWREIFTMPVQFRLNYQSGGNTTITIFNNQKSQVLQIPLSQKVSSAEMDPGNWILKKILPPAGTAQDESIILSYSLYNNYPNPFNSSTRVKFSLAAKDFVQLKVYDILGRESAVLVNQELPAGIHETTWDAAGFTSGVYFLKFKAGKYTEMKKIVLLK